MSESNNTQKNNSFIAFCKSHLENQENEFTYVYQDTDFVVKVQPIWPFVLNYAKIRNRTDEITQVLDSLKQYQEKVIMASFIRLSPEFADLLTGSHPRFTVHIDDSILIVTAQDDFIANKNHPATEKLLSGIPAEYLMTKDVLSKTLTRLLEEPELVEGKTEKADKIEAYIKTYLPVLEKAFWDMAYRIHFKPNPKFGPYSESFPTLYIGFEDMSDNEVNIRLKSGDEYNDENDKIIAHYNSLKDLLKDGWNLD